MHRLILICFAFLCILHQLDLGGAATTGNSPKSRNLRIVKTKSKNSTVYISSRLSTDGNVTEQACECTLFYSCLPDDAVTLDDDSKPCSTNEVCCKVETPLDSDNTAPDPIEIATVSSTSTSSTSSPNPTEGSTDLNCKCVPTKNCRRSLSDEQSGADFIDPRNLRDSSVTCSSDQVCCRDENIISDETTSTNPPNQGLKCGERRGIIDVRVVAPKYSSNTIFGEFPWMAYILKTSPNSGDEFVCGASLLNANVLLTAAHCINKLDASVLKVRVGDYDIKAETSEEPFPYQERTVSSVSIHPAFKVEVLFNDLAVIVPSEPFTLTRQVFPICSLSFDSEFAGQVYDPNNCLATGWGKPGSDSQASYSSTLKKVELSVVDNNQCQEKLRTTRLKKYFVLDPSFMCAGGQQGYDTCVGDGGGPLICPLKNNANQYIQVGVTSWGIGCGNNLPGVYASLDANSAWLSDEYNKYKTISPSESSADDGNFRKKSRSVL